VGLRAVLHVTSWVDSDVVYGQHYYGRLTASGFEDIEVQYALGLTDAEALNGHLNEDELAAGCQYTVGELSSRFLALDKLHEEAVKLLKSLDNWPDILLQGDMATCDPQECLAHPDEQTRLKLNAIVDRFEEFDGWGCKKEEENEVQGICDEWDELIGEDK
jgi:hypothetical protein